MKKRVLLLFLTAAVTGISVTGCKQNVGTPEDNAVVEEEGGEESEAETEPGRLLGYSSADMSDPFYETLKESIRTSLEEQGDRIMVKDAENSADTQIAQISEMIDAGVDAVFLCPADWEKITPALEELDAVKYPVFDCFPHRLSSLVGNHQPRMRHIPECSALPKKLGHLDGCNGAAISWERGRIRPCETGGIARCVAR